MKKRIVIKLSGRVFGPDSAGSLKKYAAMLSRARRVCQPVVVAGGGSIARHYIKHARSYGADESSLDELGIEISRLNARLLIYALGDISHPHPPATLREVRNAVDGGQVVVAGGLHPGQSTNGTAALIAEKTGAEMFINATDVNGVYDVDPNKFKGAKLLRRISVGDLRGMLASGDSAAGGYDLIDILALKVIERSKIRTRIVGSSPDVIGRAIRGAAVGTELVLSPGR